ncbi:unnamed protein product [Caenorhabditis nigoni]
MHPSRMNRITPDDLLLEKNLKFVPEKRSSCISIFLCGMIVSAILMISLSMVMLHIKGVINYQKTLASTSVAVESTVPASTTSPATEYSTVPVTTTTVPITTTTNEPGTKLNVSTTVPTDTVPTTTTTTSPNEDQKCAKRIIGYFSDSPTLKITKNQLKKLTHVVLYTFFSTDSGMIELKDSNLKNQLEPIKKLSGDDTKVMISLGENLLLPYKLGTEKERKALADKIVDFLGTAQIDGVDLPWDFVTATSRTYNEIYSNFVKTLRETMLTKNSNLIISLTTDSLSTRVWSRKRNNSGVMFNNLKEMINNVDFINVFSMDFYDIWEVETGPSAPLYSGVHPKDYTVDFLMQKYVCKLKDPKKLNIVVPFDVRIWENVGDALEQTKSEVFRKAELKSGKVQGKRFFSRKQAEEAGIKLSEASFDETTKTSYISNKNEKWISIFEDKKSIEAKLDYVNSKNLGGIWIDRVDTDDGSDNLLDSIDFGGYCASESDNAVKYQC